MRFILSLLLIFISVVSNGDNVNHVPNFSIKLNLSDSLCNIHQCGYLYYTTHAADGTEMHLLDSCIIDQNKHFILFKGYIKEETEVSIIFTEQGPFDISVLVEPNDHLEANIDITDIFKLSHGKEMITASRHQKVYNQFKEESSKIINEKEKFYENAIDHTDSPALAYLAYFFSAYYFKDSKDRLFQKVYKKFPNYQPFINIKTKPNFPKESEVSKRFYKRYKEVIQRRLDLLTKRGKNLYKINYIFPN